MRPALLFAAALALTACSPKANEADCKKLSDYTIILGLGAKPVISPDAYKNSEAGKKSVQELMDACVDKMSQSDVHQMLACLDNAKGDFDKLNQCIH